MAVLFGKHGVCVFLQHGAHTITACMALAVLSAVVGEACAAALLHASQLAHILAHIFRAVPYTCCCTARCAQCVMQWQPLPSSQSFQLGPNTRCLVLFKLRCSAG